MSKDGSLTPCKSINKIKIIRKVILRLCLSCGGFKAFYLCFVLAHFLGLFLVFLSCSGITISSNVLKLLLKSLQSLDL